MTLGKFIIDAKGRPVLCKDLQTWGQFMEESRQVCDTMVFGYRVSTVFLGIDHNFDDEGPPVLWETMVFPDLPSGEIQERYSSRADAEAGHAATVQKVRAFLKRRRARRKVKSR
jgi:hypothetical protein